MELYKYALRSIQITIFNFVICGRCWGEGDSVGFFSRAVVNSIALKWKYFFSKSHEISQSFRISRVLIGKTVVT